MIYLYIDEIYSLAVPVHISSREKHDVYCMDNVGASWVPFQTGVNSNIHKTIAVFLLR